VSHNIGRVVTIPVTRIGPDGPLAPVSPGVWEFSFVPQPALGGGDPRFVILHLTNLTLPGASKVEVDLGYDKDVITSAAGSETWSRPVDPKLGPVVVRFVGAAGGVTLAEYGSGEPWTTTYPPSAAYLESTTNGDVFLHTDPYDPPTFQTWLECGAAFDWQDSACAAGDAVKNETARATGMIVNYHIHDGQTLVSSCSVTLIDTNLVLTARHCVADPNDLEVRSGSVTFDYATECGGAKPAPYAPKFHKVRRKLLSGNWPASMQGDWAILEIDPPPAGPIPRQLRSTNPVNGESVFAVHHPNGAVKKLQSGTIAGSSVSSVSNFDYAGGSSGSALFDSMGRVLGAALSAGGAGPFQCTVGYSPASAVLAALANPPAPTTPYDVVLVMDRSGSMSGPGTSGPGRTKMIEAREAASLFVQLVQTNAGHRIGMVSFSTSASSPPDTPPGAFNPGKQNQLVGPTSPYDGGDIGALVASGMTSIGDGLQKAMAALTGLSSSPNQRAILLMTDGMQNTPPMVASVESMLGNTEVNVVGFGTEAQLDGILMSRLAGDHGGMYTRANDGLELEKFFALSFGNIFEAGSLVDPILTLKAGERQSADLPFDICDEDRITVIVGWNDPAVRLEAVVRTPGGATVAAGPGVAVDQARTWWFTKLELPYQGEREGTWKVHIRRIIGTDREFDRERIAEVKAFISIVPSGGPKMRPILPARRLYTGDRFTPKVALLYPNGTAPYADVKVTIEGSRVSLGELVLRHGLSAPRIVDEPVDAFTATLQSIAAESGGQLPLGSSIVTVPLFDDGIHDDGGMGRDGIYGNPLDDLLKVEGTYVLHAVASYGDGCRGQRESTWSVHVAPGVDPSATGVDVTAGALRPDGTRTGTVRLTPRDKYGNPLGPGRGDRFTVTPQPGSQVTGPVSDNGDGSYNVPVAWPAAAGGPGVVVIQPERDPVPLGPSPVAGQQPWWCQRWLLWLLLLLIGLLVVLLLIAVSR